MDIEITFDPATDADVAEVKRRLTTYSQSQSFDARTVGKLIRLIECQKEEIEQRGKTIALLGEEENELLESEAASDHDSYSIFGEP